MGGLFGMHTPHISLAAEKLFQVGPLVVTNSMLMMFLGMAFVLIFFGRAAARGQLVPRQRWQNLAETIVEGLLNLVESVAGKRVGRQIFPLVAALFLFILTANWMSLALLPLVGTIGFWEESHGEQIFVPFLRPANADLNMTIAMALIAFITIQVFSVRNHKITGWLKELASPPLLTPVHIIGELSRILSLSARLFGNIFGGEVFLVVTFFLFPIVVPLVTIGLEIFFGFIQAVLFSVLTLVYVSVAAAGHGGHDEHEHGQDEHHAPAPAMAGD